MGKVKAKYRQMTACHNAGNRHAWYPFGIKSLERNSHLNSQLLPYHATCRCAVQRGLLGGLFHERVNLGLKLG